MSEHRSSYTGPDLLGHVRDIIEEKIPGARAEVSGGGGHYTIAVTAAAFAGKPLLEQQRMVYGIIAPLMKGDDAPIHAVDKLITRAQ